MVEPKREYQQNQEIYKISNFKLSSFSNIKVIKSEMGRLENLARKKRSATKPQGTKPIGRRRWLHNV
jgi:hypothetical protein